jgi:hypothetical protein
MQRSKPLRLLPAGAAPGETCSAHWSTPPVHGARRADQFCSLRLLSNFLSLSCSFKDEELGT